MAITLPGFVVVLCVLWYSMSVWRTTDRYFRDEYKNHLKKEYEKNKYLKEEELNKLLAERERMEKTVQDKLDIEDTNVQINAKSEQKVTDNFPHESGELGEIGNQYDDKKVVESGDWEDDNIPRSHVCYTDKDELCKIAQQSTEKPSQHDYTEEEFCSMQSGSADYCLP